MRTFARTLPLLLLFTILFLASEARAEHVVITSGTASHGNPLVSVFPGHNFNFAGNGISASGGEEKLGGGFSLSCSPCAPGATLTSTTSITRFTTSYLGTATYNGTTYTNVLFNGTELNFVIEPVVIPLDAPATFNLTAAFSLSGALVGSPFPSNSPIFSMTVSGQGLATLTMMRREFPDGIGYILTRTLYTFQPAAAAVPEPATLILFGTGLAGTLASVRKRRKASQERRKH